MIEGRTTIFKGVTFTRLVNPGDLQSASICLASFHKVKSDLMGEQTILCGMLQTGVDCRIVGSSSVSALSGAVLSFDKMVASGIDPGYASRMQRCLLKYTCFHVLYYCIQTKRASIYISIFMDNDSMQIFSFQHFSRPLRE